ncbi:GNAT family N-acetyltransferase [Bordetella sputigena]
MEFRDFLKRPAPSYDDIVGSVTYLLRSQNARIGLATLDHDPVGYSSVWYHYSLWADGPAAAISDLFVTERYRGQGAGQALIEHALETSRGDGVRLVTLNTNEKNVASNRIYESLGFKAYSDVWQGRQIAYRKELKSA